MNSKSDGSQYDNYAVEFAEERITRPVSMNFVIGRSESSDLVVTSPKVAYKHCEILSLCGNWMLRNWSSEGTSLVGKAIVRNDVVKIEPGTILKIGSIYIQCKSELDLSHLPLPVLKLSVLIGEKCCYLTTNGENLPDRSRPIETSDSETSETMDSSATEIRTVNGPPEEKIVETDCIINDMVSENQHLIEELRETKAALIRVINEKSDLEYVADQLTEQLKLLQIESAKGGVISEMMENELQCSICNELLINAVTLQCSHTYCEHCLQQWKRSDRICPLCRRGIQHECKTRIIDSLIERIAGILPDDTQKRRRELIVLRRTGRNS